MFRDREGRRGARRATEVDLPPLPAGVLASGAAPPAPVANFLNRLPEGGVDRVAASFRGRGLAFIEALAELSVRKSRVNRRAPLWVAARTMSSAVVMSTAPWTDTRTCVPST